MAPNPRRVRARLDEVYARLPRIECKGLCAVACVSDYDCEAPEWERMREAAGRPMVPRSDGQCGYLTAEGRCSVYEQRPLICRAWGTVETMPCPHGCLVEGERVLTFREFFDLMAEVALAAGEVTKAARLRAMLDDPETVQMAEGIARRGQEMSLDCVTGCGGRIHGKLGSTASCDRCGAIFALQW